MQVAGTLEIQMLANLARLQDDMNKAHGMVKGAVDKIEKALEILGVGFSAHALIEKVSSVVESMAKLQDASEKTGSSIEALSRAKFFADVSGSGIDSMTAALGKLSKNMSGAGNESAAASQAFKYLGLSVKDSAGNFKDPLVLYEEIAKKLAQYEDGAGKAAIAQALMGKAGAEQLPTMKKMVELQGIEATVTAEQARTAEDYQVALAQLQRRTELLWTSVVGGMLPTMKDVAGILLQSASNTDSMSASAKHLSENNTITTWADNAALSVGYLVDVLNGFRVAAILAGNSVAAIGATVSTFTDWATSPVKGNGKEAIVGAWSDIKGRMGAIWGGFSDDANAAAMSYTSFADKIRAAIAARKAAGEGETKAGEGGNKPLNFTLGDPAKEAAELKLYTSALQALEQELGGLNQQTQAQKVTYQTTQGSLQKLTQAHKEHLIEVAREIDLAKQQKKTQEVADAAYFGAIDTQEKLNASLFDSNKSMRESNEEMGKTVDQLLILKQARVDDQIALQQHRLDLMTDGAEESYLADQIRETIKSLEERKKLLADNTEATKMADAQQRIAGTWRTIESTAQQTFVSIFNAGKSAFDRLRDTLKNGLYALLYEMTLKRWLISLVTSVSGAGVAQQVFGSSAAGSTGASALSPGSWLSLGSNLSAGYSAFTGGLSSAYTTAASSSVGQWLGLSTAQSAGYMAPVYGPGGVLLSEGTGTAAGGLTQTGAALGTGLSYVGAGLAGIGVGSMIAGNKTVIGLDGTTTSAIGAVIGAALGVPLGAFVGGVAGGIVNAAFGMGPKEAGTTTLAGQFSGSGFAGNYQTPWHQDGGWFRSDKSGTDTTALGDSQQTALSNLVAGTKSVYDRLITASGEANRSITDWTFSINQAVNTTEEQNQLTIDMATSMGNFLIPSLAQFQKEGENLADTAVRMGDEFALTDKIATLLGKDVSTAFGAVGLASMSARDSLVSLMGGIQSMTSTVQSYYTNFFSDAERHTQDLAVLSAQFKALGVDTMPKTRAAFRALAEQQDLSTDAGRQMYASLMALNTAFAAVTQSTDDAAKAAQESLAARAQAAQEASNKLISDSFSALGRAVEAEKTALQTSYESAVNVINAQLEKANENISKMTSFSNELTSTLNGMSIVGSDASSRVSAQAQIETALTIARAGGPLPVDGQLTQALKDVSKPSEAMFGSFVDYARDFYKTANDINDLNSLTDASLTTEEQIKKALDDQAKSLKTQFDTQVAYYDSILSNAQKQIDAINGVDTSVKSVQQALADFTSAISGALAGSKAAAQQPYSINDTPAQRQAKVEAQTGVVISANDSPMVAAAKALYQSVNGGSSTAQYNAAAAAVGGDIAAALGWNGGKEQLEQYREIYGFASGGFHDGGYRIVGENGPELEYTPPSRIFSNPQSKSLFDVSELVAEIKQLREEVKRGQAQIAANTKLAADALDSGGGPILVEIAQ